MTRQLYKWQTVRNWALVLTIVIIHYSYVLAAIQGFRSRRARAFRVADFEAPEDRPRPDVALDPNLDEECQCKKVSHGQKEGAKKSYCSDHATERGPNQKVISYSDFGEKKSRYFDGIQSNLKLAEIHYPGYAVRLYHDRTWRDHRDDMLELCSIFCNSRTLDLCNVNRLETDDGYPLSHTRGTLWRFAPMRDPLVGEWHSRDLDSRLSSREAVAVQDWLESDKTFHVMRDHTHHEAVILAGLFGMSMSEERHEEWRRLFGSLIAGAAYSKQKGVDQYLLKWYLWPLAKVDMVAHDTHNLTHCATVTSANCFQIQTTDPGPSREWSTDRETLSAPRGVETNCSSNAQLPAGPKITWTGCTAESSRHYLVLPIS